METYAKIVPSLGELDWEGLLGQTIMHMKKENWSEMKGTLVKLRYDIVETLSASSVEQGAYQRSYQNINQLAMLHEIQLLTEKFLMANVKQLSSAPLGSTEFLSELTCRASYTQKSWTVLEPVLRLRRCVLSLAVEKVKPYNSEVAKRLDYEVGECWLRSARLARECGQYVEAYGILNEVKKHNNPELFLETARLNWERHQETAAINILKKGLLENFSAVEKALRISEKSKQLTEAFHKLSEDQKRIFCQSKVLLAKYLEDSKSVSTEKVHSMYNQVKNLTKTDAEVWFNYAHSVDKQIHKMTPDQQIQHSELIYHSCIAYIKAMAFDPDYIHHSLPRMLTTWLDFAELVEKLSKVKGKNQVTIAAVDHAAKIVRKFLENYRSWKNYIPSYFFLTALPQLVSRLCHPHEGSYNLLHTILTDLLSGSYSQQTFWHLVSVSKNRDELRRNRCLMIFADAQASSRTTAKFLSDAVKFAGKLDELCDLKMAKTERTASLQEKLPSMIALINSSKNSKIILPNQRNLSVNLPTADGNIHTHQPFPAGIVNIEAIEDQILIMPSLVQPKKITFRGDDGHLYSFLAKPKDDLRRDSRLMDYIWVLNKLFRKDRKSRSRNLHIRSYSVIPTNETSGLIEWIDNLKGLRQIILQLHIAEGRSLNGAWIKQHQPGPKATLEEKISKLKDCIKAQDGAVFSNWFINNFPDPRSWFMARMSFVRSTAVMSMIGYIIGLGDRHLENINVDTTTGETFHVDMNCLFNKGETLNVPEVVPFRLTHNMLDAFGPVGVEGPFRIACEIALKVCLH